MRDNRLTAQDLMIGDWVSINGKQVWVWTLTQHGIVGYKDGDHSYYGSEDDVEPIPLTAETLEKNLSTTSQIQYCWDDFLSNSFGEDFYEIRYHGDVTELVISIRYVHELQHALKLCKIEKEVVL